MLSTSKLCELLRQQGCCIGRYCRLLHSLDAFSSLRGFLGLFHGDSSLNESEKTPLFLTFQEK